MTTPKEAHDGQDSPRRRRSDFTDTLTLRIVTACDAVGELVEYWGFKKVQGRVWTYVVLSRHPRHQNEIAEALEVSKSLVSLTVTELMERNLVRAVDDRRNAPIEASLDVWPTVSEILRSREWMLLESARVALEDVRAELEWQEEDDRQYNIEHVSRVLSIIELVQSLLKVVMSVRRPEPATGQESGWMQKASSLIGQLRRRRA